VAITYFNWAEIILLARRDPAAIIILAYAQTSLYNEFVAKNLIQRLNIHHVPSSLFSDRLLVQHKNSLECTYKTREPLSYFNNPDFLFLNVSAKEKVSYLRALSMRRISDTSNSIPRDYFNKVANNHFLKVDEDYIHFPLESSVSRKSYTKEPTFTQGENKW